MSGLNGQFNSRLQTLERMQKEGGSSTPILYQFEVGKTTPQDIINAVKAGKLVVMRTQIASHGWGDGLNILMGQYEYSEDTYGVRFIAINSGGNGVSVNGAWLVANGLNSAYIAGET